jgi:hypothetical protein
MYKLLLMLTMTLGLNTLHVKELLHYYSSFDVSQCEEFFRASSVEKDSQMQSLNRPVRPLLVDEAPLARRIRLIGRGIRRIFGRIFGSARQREECQQTIDEIPPM